MDINEMEDTQFEQDFTMYKDKISEAPARLQDRIRERLQTEKLNDDK